MTFPNVNAAWEYTRVGLSNVIPLVESGGPYTVSVDKASAGYTAQVLTSPNLDASPQDDSWEAATAIDTSDVVSVAVAADVRAIMISITVRPSPVGDARIAPCKLTVSSSKSVGIQNKRRHASGYGGNLFAGAPAEQDPYSAMVLADMAAHGNQGAFYAMQDGQLLTLTDTGPDGSIDCVGGVGASFSSGEPWPLANNIFDTFWNYRSLTVDMGGGASQTNSAECWFHPTSFPTITILIHGNSGGLITQLDTGGLLSARWHMNTAFADPGIWAASTVYAKGDRRRKIADNGRFVECEIAGTSDTSEPVWPTNLGTVVDSTVTWRDVGQRSLFHDMGGQTADRLVTASPVSAGIWHHMVASRTATGYELWLDGVLADSFANPAADTFRGTFGTPRQFQFDTADYNTGRTAMDLGIQGGSNLYTGRMAYVALYRTALTPTQVVAHYDKGVALGLNP